MQFCPKCGTRLRFTKLRNDGGAAAALVCEKCGFQLEAKGTISKPEETNSQLQIRVIGDEQKDLKAMPTATADCPKCGNDEAFWWLLQTRGGDEPTTQFYRCTKCEHTWRSYA